MDVHPGNSTSSFLLFLKKKKEFLSCHFSFICPLVEQFSGFLKFSFFIPFL